MGGKGRENRCLPGCVSSELVYLLFITYATKSGSCQTINIQSVVYSLSHVSHGESAISGRGLNTKQSTVNELYFAR